MAYRGSRPVAVWLLIGINLLLYVVISVNPNFFVELLGLQPISLLERPWTMITNLFVHAPFPRIWHILGNMITLFFFGTYLSRWVGDRKFLLVYFGGGICGNILFILLNLSSNIPAIGLNPGFTSLEKN